MLKSGSAPGLDGITLEHLKFALQSSLPTYLAVLLTLCFRFGVVPDSFCRGLLVPVMKKANLDPTECKSYRPITVSSVISKIMELFILDMCTDYSFSKFQFGFFSKCSTAMATTFAHDVGEYCNARGSPVFYCSLDAEGAFDAIPFPILFDSASHVLPVLCWTVMYYWNSHMYVQIRWNNHLSAQIPIRRGTRQGGLTSPTLFNAFYQELVQKIENCNCGIILNNKSYNVFAYADDLLLASTTTTGLQSLIDLAVSFVTQRGLKFNPSKTTCMVYGKSPFTSPPKWHINDVSLEISNSVKYLGTLLNNSNGKDHVESRIRAANRPFYTLQGAGVCMNGLSPFVSAHVYNIAIRSGLLYGCNSLYLSKSNLLESHTWVTYQVSHHPDSSSLRD